jgi:hypothetical protein
MNQETFNEVVTTTLEACKSTLTKKRDEYVTDVQKDVLSNFKNNAELSIVGTPEGIAWELLTKHLQSIKDYCNGRDVSKEVLDEKIGDSINYLLLIKGLLVERGFAITKHSQVELIEGLVEELSNKPRTGGLDDFLSEYSGSKYKVGSVVAIKDKVTFGVITYQYPLTAEVLEVSSAPEGNSLYKIKVHCNGVNITVSEKEITQQLI